MITSSEGSPDMDRNAFTSSFNNLFSSAILFKSVKHVVYAFRNRFTSDYVIRIRCYEFIPRGSLCIIPFDLCERVEQFD